MPSQTSSSMKPFFFGEILGIRSSFIVNYSRLLLIRNMRDLFDGFGSDSR